ncbi:MAG TPA: YhfC family glutamic-type intramembrane protease [Atribacterota bacterium]|nr:YhfC family glutamic-type intramembrane protease [Atribacterota bacterium]
MEYSVPTLSIVFMVIVALTGIIIPIVLFTIFRKKYKANIAPFFIGCTVFIIFALLLERFFITFLFKMAAGKVIRSSIWLYGIFGGLMAGLFEETGRFTAFKTILKKSRSNDANALMYGAGHGGFEAFYILVFSMISNIIMSVMLNLGLQDKLISGVTDEAKLRTLYATFAVLAGTPPVNFLMGIVERIAAVALHISLSVLVWFAAGKEARCFWFYPLAILLHSAVDAIAVIMSKYLPNVWAILAVIYVLSTCCVMLALKVWNIYSSQSDISGISAGTE